MPRATVSSDTVRKDLMTLPGGWVELKRMSFGAKQKRQDMAMQMAFTGDPKKGDTRGELNLNSRDIAVFEFAQCVVDHNLYADEEETVKLQLGSPRDIERLDPRVGEEIGKYIDELNNVTEEDLADLGNGSSE